MISRLASQFHARCRAGAARRCAGALSTLLLIAVAPGTAAADEPLANTKLSLPPAGREVQQQELLRDLPESVGRDELTPRPALPSAKSSVSGVRVLWMEATAYCPCPKCCGPSAKGITASGHGIDYNAGRFVAADTELLPFYTRLRVPGYRDGMPVEVIDRGSAIKGRRIDVFFPTHAEALAWGRRWVAVTILP